MIAWRIARQHRWGLLAVCAYVVMLATTKLFFASPVDARESQRFAFTVLVPLTIAVLYLTTIFGLGLSGDFSGRESLYPSSMFTLPLTSAELAGWPMLYGAAAVIVLWMSAALFALRPSGVEVPLVWPALYGAVFLAWTQVLTWKPFGVRGLRALAALLLLVTVDTGVVLGVYGKVSPALMTSLLVPQLPIAYLLARRAVAKARCGDTPDWRMARTAARAGAREHASFSSPAAAQFWLEWRQHGRSLPRLVGILLPFELALLLMTKADGTFAFFVVLGILLTPPFMAAVAAAMIRKARIDGGAGLSAFTATKPVADTALIMAKLRMTLASTLITWLLVLAGVAVGLRTAGLWPDVLNDMHKLADAFGTPRATVVLLLGLAALVLSTWKNLVQSLYIGLSGRDWLTHISLFITLTLIVLAMPLIDWLIANIATEALWHAIRWIPAVYVAAKLCAAAWVAVRLSSMRLISDRALVLGAACWTTSVFALYAVLAWLFATPHMPVYFLMLVAMMVVPLSRISAAPVAIAWNRHR